MRIAVDAMGGDHAPEVTVKGSIDAVKEYGINVVLVGNKNLIEKELKKYDYDRNNIEIVHTEEAITNEEEPVKAIRKKKDSSMVVAMNMVKDKEADAVISAGSTGALLAGGLFIIKRIKGIDRGALASVYPTKKGISLLLDAGANTDSRAKYLQQFAIMGSVYSNKVLGVENPKVGLINIGVEEGKGNGLTKEAFKLLSDTDVNFYGNLEARDIPEGYADVMVADGFVGNIVLKLTEGLALSIFSMLKEEFMKSFKSKIGALMLKPGLKQFKKKLDYSEYGGAPLLGIKRPVIKAHGSSNSRAIKNAIRQAKVFVENNVIEKIENDIEKLGGNDDTKQ
ncbi:phosphate acyltransferase PlsX [Sporosalibacterium faouarense]|uniref:phosphate acyltransferase PlsX n=1 Tax=Sporosalibacterium faouarense TaxID=516123 RepID=UPI00192B6B57|nr:phosphate acyltransferase PlsX [Sporosalibacterium faouarense]